jgi:hypothetical protein
MTPGQINAGVSWVKAKPYPGRESGSRAATRVSRVKPEHSKFLIPGWVSLTPYLGLG